MLRGNMRREMITQEELISLIREQGAECVDEVKACYLEGDGSVSVIKQEPDEGAQHPKKKKCNYSDPSAKKFVKLPKKVVH